MTDERGPIRQNSGNLEEFQAAIGELTNLTATMVYEVFVAGKLEALKGLARMVHDLIISSQSMRNSGRGPSGVSPGSVRDSATSREGLLGGAGVKANMVLSPWPWGAIAEARNRRPSGPKANPRGKGTTLGCWGTTVSSRSLRLNSPVMHSGKESIGSFIPQSRWRGLVVAIKTPAQSSAWMGSDKSSNLTDSRHLNEIFSDTL